MAEPNYENTIQRIIDILKADNTLKELVREFRFGDLGDEAYGRAMPSCYVTTASSPEISRTILGPGEYDKAPAETVETEYWVVFLASGATPESAQKTIYRLRDAAISALRANATLTKDGTDPQCSTSTISSIRRLVKNTGTVLEGITIRVMCTNHILRA